MALSRRQTLFDAVLVRLRLIVVVGGNYQTNIGGNVFAWRNTKDQPFTPAELSIGAINVRDHSEKTEQGGPSVLGKHHHTLNINIEGVVDSGVEANVIRQMIADITKAIGVDRKWGGTAYDTDPGDDSILVAENGITITGFAYNFAIQYRTSNFDPYTA